MKTPPPQLLWYHPEIPVWTTHYLVWPIRHWVKIRVYHKQLKGVHEEWACHFHSSLGQNLIFFFFFFNNIKILRNMKTESKLTHRSMQANVLKYTVIGNFGCIKTNSHKLAAQRCVCSKEWTDKFMSIDD